MRGWLMALGVIVLAAGLAAPTAHGQDSGPPAVQYWGLREISYPVPVDKFKKMNPRPTKLRFFVAPERGKFKQVTERGLDDLDSIDTGTTSKRGFHYTSPADGEYDFALQLVYEDGDTQPRDDALRVQSRMVFDTRPPAVQIATSGTSGVEWSVTDENMDPDGVQLQVRFPQESRDWYTVPTRQFKPRDQYTWKSLNPNRPLEVRIVAKDRAGHESPSRVVTLPSNGTGGGLMSDGGSSRNGNSYGQPDGFVSGPKIDYVNFKDLTVVSKLTKVTRSGVKAAQLWVNDGKGGWKKEKEIPQNIPPGTMDKPISIPFKAPSDGLYGFIVIPINGADKRQDDPRQGDQAQMLIEVDTQAPFVKVTNVLVSPGGTEGERVEIQWKAEDNLMPDPIVLEYMDASHPGEWKTIAEKIPNTGRYVWQVEDKALWKFKVRASAVDKASNRAEDVYSKDVIIDLDKPQAVVDRVQGGPGGTTAVRESNRPVVEGTPASTPAPAPAPLPTPTTPSTPPPYVPPSGDSAPTPIPALPPIK